MKAILEFDLPDDDQAHQDALHGAEYRAAIQMIDRYLRDQLKYLDDLSADGAKELKGIREMLRNEAPAVFKGE
jgi:hypothetical protein